MQSEIDHQRTNHTSVNSVSLIDKRVAPLGDLEALTTETQADSWKSLYLHFSAATAPRFAFLHAHRALSLVQVSLHKPVLKLQVF